MKEYHCMCGQLFDDIIDQNEHILTHFDKKQCIGCDNHLIFVAGKWYQPHIDDCDPIKIEPEYDHLNIDSTLPNEIVEENVAECPNIELIELTTLKEECIDEEIEENERIGNVDSSLIEQVIHPIECRQCGRTFTRKYSLKRHQKTCSNSAVVAEFPSIILVNLPTLTEECVDGQLKQGQISDNSNECELCGHSFTRRTSLKRHQKVCFVNSSKNLDDEPPQEKSTNETKKKPMHKSDISEDDAINMNCNYRIEPAESNDKPSQSSTDAAVQVINIATVVVPSTTLKRQMSKKPIELELDASTSLDVHSLECSDGETSIAVDVMKPFRCELCSKLYTYKRRLDKHQENCGAFRDSKKDGDQVKSDQRLYDIEPVKLKRDATGNLKCNYCPLTFKQINKLEAHKRSFHRECLTIANIKCAKCPKIFPTEKLLQSHMLWKHKPLKEAYDMQFICYMCQKAHRFPKELMKHLQTHPNVEYKCCFDGCSNQYESCNPLYFHILNHLRIECKRCGKSITKVKFDHHQCTTGEKCICDYCGKAFGDLYSLKYHMNIHTGRRPYTCDVCKKSFGKPSGLSRHRNIHFGTTRYTCDVANCNRAFNQTTDLYRHRFKVHGIFRKKFPCTLCDQVFPENALLRKHMTNHENV